MSTPPTEIPNLRAATRGVLVAQHARLLARSGDLDTMAASDHRAALVSGIDRLDAALQRMADELLALRRSR